jgi:hypothetical protein
MKHDSMCFLSLAVRRLGAYVGYNHRPVLDTKIMCTQVFGPPCLTSVELLCRHMIGTADLA